MAPSSGFVLPGIIALVFSLVVTAGLSLAGVKAVEALGMEKGNYLEKNGDKLKSLPLVGTGSSKQRSERCMCRDANTILKSRIHTYATAPCTLSILS